MATIILLTLIFCPALSLLFLFCAFTLSQRIDDADEQVETEEGK